MYFFSIAIINLFTRVEWGILKYFKVDDNVNYKMNHIIYV